MMKGYFIYNKFLNTEKFGLLRKAFSDEANLIGMDLAFMDNSKSIQMIYSNNLDKRDFVLFWDKDIKLARILEDEGYLVINSSKAIEVCDDKSKTYINLYNTGIRQPLTIIAPLIFYGTIDTDSDFLDFSVSKLGFPMIIKECFGSFGEQVYLVNNKDELIKQVKKIGTKPFVLQEFIKTSFGRDVRIEVIGNEVVASVYRENKNNDFRANITNGAIARVYMPSDKQVEMALKVCATLNLDFAGVDILFGDDDEPILCEVNSNAYPLNVQSITGVNIINKTLMYIKNKVLC